MSNHFHIDAVGGISGDMFLAAMLSAFPDINDTVQADLAAAGLVQHITMTPRMIKKSGFAATQIHVVSHPAAPPTHHWREIRAFLKNSGLSARTKQRAIDIFTHLAEAEAHCHDIPVENVHFHEIADWDSIADIVAAASAIEASKAGTWSVGLLPIGRGRVQTQHGLIPVPAPATVRLLQEFAFFDDGGAGERITPTGAAILRHLSPSQNGPPKGATLGVSGTGAGQRDIDGIPNICRILQFDISHSVQDQVTEISFEIDDMTPEEISISLDNVRAADGVLDAGYAVRYGKKGRIQFGVSVLADPIFEQTVANLCLSETSTLGVRIGSVRRLITARQAETVSGLRVKRAERANGQTTKVESDDLQGIATLKSRREMAHKVEMSDDQP